MKTDNTNNIKSAAAADGVKKLGAQKITLIITAAVLLVALIAGIVIAVINNINKEKELAFDYITSDLSEYLNIDKSVYKDYSLTLDIAKPHDIDLDVTLFNLLALKKGDVKNDALAQPYGNIDAGDIVNIYYRGYTFDKDGNELPLETNFGNSAYSSLEVGIGITDKATEQVYAFHPGFDLSLAGGVSALTEAGRYFDSKNNFVKITEGAPKTEQILYIGYTRELDGSTSSSDNISKSSERVILANGKDEIDKKYGAGFYDTLMSMTVGSTDTKTLTTAIDGKTYNYKNIKISFATECEKNSAENGGAGYFLVECYIPYTYTLKDLRNKTAYYEVYVESIVEHDEKKLTKEFVEEVIADEEYGKVIEDIDSFEGDRVTQLRACVQKLIDDEYKDLYEAELEEAMWNHYHEKITDIKKYPKVKVNAVYTEYFDDVLYQFEQSGGSYTDQYTGSQKNYDNIDDYAVAYLGLTYSENKDWRAHLRSLAENLIKERLILFYILKAENIMPTAEELAAKKKEVEDDYLEEYINQYVEKYAVEKDDLTEEEWKEFESKRYNELHEFYNDEYFTEVAYYEVGLEEFIKWPSVTTLDGKQQ